MTLLLLAVFFVFLVIFQWAWTILHLHLETFTCCLFSCLGLNGKFGTISMTIAFRFLVICMILKKY